MAKQNFIKSIYSKFIKKYLLFVVIASIFSFLLAPLALGITGPECFDDYSTEKAPHSAQLDGGYTVTTKVAQSDDVYATQSVSGTKYIYLYWDFDEIPDDAIIDNVLLSLEHKEDQVLISVQWDELDNGASWIDVCDPPESSYDIVSTCDLSSFIDTATEAQDIDLRLKLEQTGTCHEYLDWAYIEIDYRVECPPYCGDGVVDYGEECDDGNNVDGDGCDSNCQLEIPDCVDADYEYDFDLKVFGENCCNDDTIEETASIDVPVGARYSVEGQVWRGKPGECQTNEDFYLEINGETGTETEDDADPCAISVRMDSLGDFDFNTGLNDFIMHTASTCPPDTHPNSVSLKKLCLYYIEECGNGILDVGEECDDGNNDDGDGCSSDCTEEECNDDSDCDDGLWCNGEETCNLDDYTCEDGTLVNCDEGISCTDDFCNEQTDSCDNDPNDSLCDNDLFCDGLEYCDPNLDCQDGPEPDCDDNVDCTVDSCNEQIDSCDNDPDDSYCDNGLYCDGEEYCDIYDDCQDGTAVDCSDDLFCTITERCDETQDKCVYDDRDCSANNIDGIASCFNIPDDVDYTWDYRVGFTSVCDEDADGCTIGDYTITHTCDYDQCNADCDATHQCEDNECEKTYDDYCTGNKLTEYDNDKVMDSTTVSDSCANSCQADCTCTDCSVDCSAPGTNTYCVKDICGAECAVDVDCGTNICDELDGCDGTTYVDYDDVPNTCVGCECVVSECTVYTEYPDDIRCNKAPTASIISPIDGSNFKDGHEIVFSGLGDDTDGTIVSYEWTSNLDGVIGNTNSFSLTSLSIGVHAITLTVTDDDGAEGDDIITVTVVELHAPVASITSPENGDNYKDGQTILFSGTGSDSDGTIVSYEWTSNLDGVIGNTNSFSLDSLSVGIHAITLTVTDDDTLTGSDSITIEVKALQAPIASILNPNEDDHFKDGHNILFSGTGTDADGYITKWQWSSDIDGVFYTQTDGDSSSFYYDGLSLGTHTISLTVTDDDGLEYIDVASIVIDVNPEFAPTASIVSPSDGSVYREGDNIIFSGYGDDVNGYIVGYYWVSSIDGTIGDAMTFNLSSLSVGEHTITLTVTDDDSQTGDDSITITVLDNDMPTASITSPADGDNYKDGQTILFSGYGDNEIITAYTWTSNLDGTISNDQTFSTDSLTIGEHIITFTVTDDDAQTAQDSITITVNALVAPTASIISPEDGADYKTGQSVLFNGIGDDTDGIITSYQWVSNVDGVIGDTNSFSLNSLSIGLHTITLTVRDDDGLTGSDEIQITIKPLEAPTASILNPKNGETFKFGEDIFFNGTGYDPDGLIVSYQWLSDVDGVIEEGTCNAQLCEFSFTKNDLSLGKHDITLTVVDDDVLMYTDTDTVWIVINPLLAPDVEIISPLDGAEFVSNNYIDFQGIAADSDGTIVSYEWTSDISGELKSGSGYPENFSMQLPAGKHLITLITVDDDGQTGQDFANVIVNKCADTDEDGYCDDEDYIIGFSENVTKNMPCVLFKIILENGTVIEDPETYDGLAHAVFEDCSGNILTEFDYLFGNETIFYLTNVAINVNEDNATGSIAIGGIDLTPQNRTKTIYLDNINNVTSICIRDDDTASVSLISGLCIGANEYPINCPGTANNDKYNCTFTDETNTTFKITGLDHSAAKQQSYCGDGNVDPGEQCEGSNLAGKNCGSFGYNSGSLSCTSSCTIDTSGCYNTDNNNGGGSSGGGGGGGGSSGFTSNENWECEEWSECSPDGMQFRDCVQRNSEGLVTSKESQECTYAAPAVTDGSTCTEIWECTEWSECIDGIQTRTCTDINGCTTEFDKPLESQECEIVVEEAARGFAAITGAFIANLGKYPGILWVLVLLILAVVYYYRKQIKAYFKKF